MVKSQKIDAICNLGLARLASNFEERWSPCTRNNSRNRRRPSVYRAAHVFRR